MSQTSTTSLAVSVAMDTHIGRKRQQNQDAIGHFVPTDPAVLDELGQIFVLADGVGGLKGGDLASQYAVSTIISSYYDQPEGEPADRLARAIAEANNVIYDEGQSQDSPTTMATTVVAAVLRGRDLIVGSVGDSPAYLIREAHPRKLTLDHVALPAPETPPDTEPGSPRLVRALGVAASVKVDIITGRGRDGDGVVLCSDGLTRYATPEEIARTVTDQPLADTARALIEMANERGGADNISVIVLRLADDNLAILPPLDDPMLGWGRPRRALRARATPPDKRVGSPVPPPADTEPADNPLMDLWRLLRSNTILTGIGMAVLLVIFAAIMLAIAQFGDDEEPGEQHDPAAVSTEAAQRTATATLIVGLTAHAAAAQTTDAIQAATAAEAVRRTLTPPTPIPTSGPQMSAGIWFRVLPGDPVPAYEQPDPASAEATALEADANYRVTAVDHERKSGPWYQVVDNLGQEVRWVSGPALYQRVVAIDPAGNPLPADQQPLDVPPPDLPSATASPAQTATPALTGTPGTPPPTTRPTIAYGEEQWTEGDRVTTKDALDLCRVPDVTVCDTGQVESGETGTIVEGPLPAGEHWWWKVEFEGERSGWVAQVLLAAP